MYQPPRNTGIRLDGQQISINQPFVADNRAPLTESKYSLDVPMSSSNEQEGQDETGKSETLVSPSPTPSMDVDRDLTPSIQGDSTAERPKLDKIGPIVASSRRFKKFDSWLIKNVRDITLETYPSNNAPLFVLENTMEAAKTNTEILKAHDWDFAKAIASQENTIMQAGSEYRPWEKLEPLLKYHKDWEKMKSILTDGVTYGFDKDIEYTEETRMKDVEKAVQKGNNKSAQGCKDIIMSNYNKEVIRAWMVPFLRESVMKVVGVGVIPIGIAKQWTMDKDNNRVQKFRTAHDLSNPMLSGHSWNSMIDEDLMDPCLFGWCLVRILHRIHDIREKHPNESILISKIDLDAAFRRMHVCSEHSVLSTTIIDEIAYFLGRLPFGTCEGPGKHDIPSNMIVELAQKIADDPTWDPNELFSPRAKDIPEDLRLPADEPFGKAHHLKVDMGEFKPCYMDGFIDDLISTVLDKFGLPDRARNAVALALHTFFRPINEGDPVPRDDILSLRKLLAEGRLEETKMVLGWYIDTRAFIIKLAKDKALRWIMDMDDILQKIDEKAPVSAKDLESLIGKLNTASYIHTDGRFFLSRIRYCHSIAKKNRGSTILPLKVKLDLLLWKKFLLRLSTKGRSINHITYTYPHWFTKQDASESAMGGFNCTGLAWRFIIPPELRKLIHINVLEFLAVLVTTWLSILQLDFVDLDGIKLLAQSDNQSTLGWMKGSTRYDALNKLSTMLREEIGRKLAELLCDAGLSCYSQHIAGRENRIADHLSREIQMSNDEQIHAIKSQFSQICPDNLRMVALPSIILSWIQSFWEKSIRTMVLPKPQRTKLLAAAASGTSSQPKETWTLSCEISQNQRKLKSSVLSRTRSDITTLAEKLQMNLEDRRYEPKSTQYLRRSDQWDSTTPFEMHQENSASF